MRKSFQIVLALSIALFACTEEEKECTTPEGIIVNIPNNQFFCFKTGSVAGNCSFATSTCCSDILFAPLNFIAATSVSSTGTKGTSSIASAGSFSKLCEITTIPSGGFTGTMAADYDIGYVVKLADGTYARFVVTDFGTSTSGGVLSVQIAYEYPFNP